jgi:hypothetical protein
VSRAHPGKLSRSSTVVPRAAQHRTAWAAESTPSPRWQTRPLPGMDILMRWTICEHSSQGAHRRGRSVPAVLSPASGCAGHVLRDRPKPRPWAQDPLSGQSGPSPRASVARRVLRADCRRVGTECCVRPSFKTFCLSGPYRFSRTDTRDPSVGSAAMKSSSSSQPAASTAAAKYLILMFIPAHPPMYDISIFFFPVARSSSVVALRKSE